MDEREELERLLRQELRPRNAPPGFSARVMGRLPGALQTDSLQKKRPFWLPAVRWAAAALLLGVAGGSYWEHQQKERIAGERARGQLMLALRISGATLNDIQHKVMRDAKGDVE